MSTLNQTWDLDVFFTGGSNSSAFNDFLAILEKDTQDFYAVLSSSSAPLTLEASSDWLKNLNTYQDLAKRLVEASAFTSCLRAQNMQDKQADLLGNTVQSLFATFKSCETLLDTQIAAIPEATWEALLKTDELKDVQFPLNEKRHKAKELLPADQEQLINVLSVDGYHAWGDLYDTIVGEMEIPFDHPKKGQQTLSVGQLANLMNDGDRSVRQKAFAAWEEAWQKQSEFAASALNHLAGFRLGVYKQRNWDDILKEPLEYNRMSGKTLEAMWKTITRFKPQVVKYLQRKAELLGLEKLDWHDVEAPLSSEDKEVSYDEAAAFIEKNFNQFNPAMGAFAKHALEHRWVEAEDRSGKRPGGFCTSFPLTQQSRIFMTYGGSASNVSTLAHELGHAYHQHVMNDIPYLNQDYAMNVAETASTFAELIVSDASIKAAESKEEQVALLEDKLQRAVAFFMNIHARFLFETRFYEERKNGIVSVDRLNELMLEAQKEAYCEELGSYHPSFWESKLHFYITGVPFYNFPYTFGYMFSTGIYARALEEGPTFADKYDALLRDTGAMTVEELALKHLGVNLEQDIFWEEACEQIVKDVDQFLELTK
ncbi:pepF/M3 family oligoendopeptidase [Pullulanibacillus pueri]|uniref:Oligoendopeptidase n=1 Tax=Pullulanibacillus pueri TaxID=1437324 RepID=A0A8J2ZUJ3_9BACL|nr:M3 family oligoendopeptidase [Pullulanibacillus pueri]MBM7680744.1 pepF/M3 family oligoendopeptidase [Pullulanibacillus pueri]GGH78171.1 oligoendopeptidase [Pullulanibacillus pueri]